MFKRKFRASVLKKPYKVLPFQFFTVRIGKNNLSYSRFSVVVSKKVDKRATFRNKLKRSIRTCLKGFASKIQLGYDMIVVAKKDLAVKTQNEMCELIQTSLSKEGLLT